MDRGRGRGHLAAVYFGFCSIALFGAEEHAELGDCLTERGEKFLYATEGPRR